MYEQVSALNGSDATEEAGEAGERGDERWSGLKNTGCWTRRLCWDSGDGVFGAWGLYRGCEAPVAGPKLLTYSHP